MPLSHLVPKKGEEWRRLHPETVRELGFFKELQRELSSGPCRGDMARFRCLEPV